MSACLSTAGVVVCAYIVMVDKVNAVLPVYRLNPELVGCFMPHIFIVQ
jgi:hypothetical protein